MLFVIGVLTLVMVLVCLVLVFLVLIQLPKKEAGAGLAFGGSATDALFGAGSGTVLTKITKYAAGIFFAMALLLSVLQRNLHGGGQQLLQKMQHPEQLPGAAAQVMPPKPVAPPTPTTNLVSQHLEATNPIVVIPESTNVNRVPTTNTPSTPSTSTNAAKP